MKVITCLGNPGKKYLKTRHNIGFILGDFFAQKFQASIKNKKALFLSGETKINGENTHFLFPQTYMNSSGEAVQFFLNYHKVSPQNLLVIHDEIELPFGDMKIKLGGGHKGHNGLRSIIQHLSSSDFYRLRFGVGRPNNPRVDVADYVLSNFTPEEITELNHLLDPVETVLLNFIEEKLN